MCNHTKPPTYWHVYDHDTAETIATYTNGHRAMERMCHELESGRNAVSVNPGAVA